MKRLSGARVVVLVVSMAAAVTTASPTGSSSSPQALKPSSPQSSWYKGNLHTHTLNSDGDSTPDEVVRWYRERGYGFLVLTDHNFLTGVDGLNALHGADERFLVIKGEELTDRVDGKPIHVNGFDVDRQVPLQGGATVVEMVQRMVDAVRSARGVPAVNHPNFGWAITADELRQIARTRLFEVYNGHPLVNNVGGGGSPGTEEIWDRILSSGRLLYGVAVDDAHHFKPTTDPAPSTPGHGWVYVRAPRLEPRAIVEALDRGDFYASTGVELTSLEATASSLTVTVKPGSSSRYRIQFIGRQGRVLHEAMTADATYTFKGDEGYVRAKVLDSNGRVAWIQPVPVGRDAPR
jgi:hypothetical protein